LRVVRVYDFGLRAEGCVVRGDLPSRGAETVVVQVGSLEVQQPAYALR